MKAKKAKKAKKAERAPPAEEKRRGPQLEGHPPLLVRHGAEWLEWDEDEGARVEWVGQSASELPPIYWPDKEVLKACLRCVAGASEHFLGAQHARCSLVVAVRARPKRAGPQTGAVRCTFARASPYL